MPCCFIEPSLRRKTASVAVKHSPPREFGTAVCNQFMRLPDGVSRPDIGGNGMARMTRGMAAGTARPPWPLRSGARAPRAIARHCGRDPPPGNSSGSRCGAQSAGRWRQSGSRCQARPRARCRRLAISMSMRRSLPSPSLSMRARAVKGSMPRHSAASISAPTSDIARNCATGSSNEKEQNCRGAGCGHQYQGRFRLDPEGAAVAKECPVRSGP